MATIETIQREIESFPPPAYKNLAHWFFERDWELWDNELEEDSQSGKLDFLIDEAIEEKQAGKLRDL